GAFTWREGSLYPSLHKMEADGLIVGEWEEKETGRKRRYYRITKQGRGALRGEGQSWAQLCQGADCILGESGGQGWAIPPSSLSQHRRSAVAAATRSPGAARAFAGCRRRAQGGGYVRRPSAVPRPGRFRRAGAGAIGAGGDARAPADARGDRQGHAMEGKNH